MIWKREELGVERCTEYLEDQVQHHLEARFSRVLPCNVGGRQVEEVGSSLCADGMDEHFLPHPGGAG